MPTLVAITLGGMLGALARHAVTSRMHARVGRAFPWGTLVVNVAGSFALGLVLPHLSGAHPPLRAFAAAGFLGAFTTFSTFAADTVALLEDRRRGRAAAYVAVSLLLGLAAIAVGMWAGGRTG